MKYGMTDKLRADLCEALWKSEVWHLLWQWQRLPHFKARQLVTFDRVMLGREIEAQTPNPEGKFA